MYEIYARYYIANPISNQKEAKDICIYNDRIQSDNMKVVDPKLVLTDSAAGSLDITLPPTNVGYDLIERMTSDITVKKDGVDIWFGRVLSESTDFWKNRTFTCEGALAFLNDTMQPQVEYEGVKVREFLTSMLYEHNKYVDDNRKIDVGAVTVGVSTIDGEDDPVYDFYTNYETTLYSLNLLKENLGGHMRIRITNDGLVLDYLKDSINARRQTISFGKNLVDFTSSWDMDEFATVILPLGAKLTKNEIKSADAYLTVKDADNGQGGKHNSIYVENAEAVSNFGWIAKRVNFDDVTDPNILLEKATEYLSSIQFENMVLEVSAFDLHYLDNDIEAIELLDKIHVISPPHGLDDWFLITELEIPLDSPEKTQFKMGSNVKNSLTDTTGKTVSEIYDRITSNGHSLLRSARENADELINNATSGYITIVKNPTRGNSDALYISDDEDYTASNRYWVWNLNGLAYYDNAWIDGSRPYPSSYHDAGYDKQGKPLPLFAITMDGAIVADAITTGILDANVIRAGVIRDLPNNEVPEIQNGKLIKHIDENNITTYKIAFYKSTDMSKSPIFTFDVDVPANMTIDEQGSRFVKNYGIPPGGSIFDDFEGEPYFMLIFNIENNGSNVFRYISPKYVSPFLWKSSTHVGSGSDLYPGSENPNLDGKSVFVLRIKDRNGSIISNSFVFIEDEYYGSNFILDLDSGNMAMKYGSIKLGAYDKNSKHYKFEVDSDGNVYAGSGVFAGRLTGADISGATGTFTGTVQADRFLDNRGRDMFSYNSQGDTLISRNYLDLGKIRLDGTTGDISMSGNLNLSGVSQIVWDSNYEPVVYMYSETGIGKPDTTGNPGCWHTVKSNADRFRCDSIGFEEDEEGNLIHKWGEPYEFVGVDVESIVDFDYINDKMNEAFSLEDDQNKFVSINSKTIRAPEIVGGNIFGADFYGNTFNIFNTPGINQIGSFNIYSDTNRLAFTIAYDNTGTLSFQAPYGTLLHLNIPIHTMLLSSGFTYGTIAQRDNIQNPTTGSIFFVIPGPSSS